MKVEGVTLDSSERNALAWADGFRQLGERRAFEEMVHYWENVHPLDFDEPFRGRIIHWDYDHPIHGGVR